MRDYRSLKKCQMQLKKMQAGAAEKKKEEEVSNWLKFAVISPRLMIHCLYQFI